MQVARRTAVKVVAEPRHCSLVVVVVGLPRRPDGGQVVGEVCDEVVLVGMRRVVGVEPGVPAVGAHEVVVEASSVGGGAGVVLLREPVFVVVAVVDAAVEVRRVVRSARHDGGQPGG